MADKSKQCFYIDRYTDWQTEKKIGWMNDNDNDYKKNNDNDDDIDNSPAAQQTMQ